MTEQQDAVSSDLADADKISAEVESWKNDTTRNQRFVNAAVENWRVFLKRFKETGIRDFNYVYSQSSTQHYLELMGYLSTADLTGVPSHAINSWVKLDNPPFGLEYVKQLILQYQGQTHSDQRGE